MALLRMILSKSLVAARLPVQNGASIDWILGSILGNPTNPLQLMAEKRPAPQSLNADAASEEVQDAVLPKIVRFTDLSRCGNEIWIEHSGQLYRLRQTRQGKLILTK